jgi:pimeloyl-ACP methyl ester carboxylesterase
MFEIRRAIRRRASQYRGHANDDNMARARLTPRSGPAERLFVQYYERAHADYDSTVLEPSTTPTAVAVFPRENFLPLRHVAERNDNIVQWSEFDRGGHFAAMQEPDLLVANVRAFFRRLRPDPAVTRARRST